MAKLMNSSIVFFGSGPVAAASLKLLSKDFTIEAVITKPRPAHHKGAFPVIELAKELDLQTYTVSNKQELDDLIESQPLTSSLGVLIDFGIIVGQKVIDHFEFGIVNSHFSLLPEWRGADPITFSILSGQKQTGVSLMLLVLKMDEGPLLAQAPLELSSSVTTPELTDELIELSHTLLQTMLPLYIEGEATPGDQLENTIISPTPTYSRKLTKEDGRIDWEKSAVQIDREIRAYLDWPKSFTTLAGKDVIITKAHSVDEQDETKKNGTAIVVDGQLYVSCSSGQLCIEKLKPAGKSEMTASAFLSGYGSLL